MPTSIALAQRKMIFKWDGWLLLGLCCGRWAALAGLLFLVVFAEHFVNVAVVHGAVMILSGD
jgi:hypothetical protein